MVFLKSIDKFLNSVTMYWLMMYSLLTLTAFAIIFSFFGILPFSPWWLFFSAIVLMISAKITNYIFGHLFKIPTNTESSIITALILFFVMTPANSIDSLFLLALISATAMITKYILNIRGKHLFNPAAIGAVIAGLIGFGASSWWISLPSMIIPTLILGLLVVRKIHHQKMFYAFLIASLVSITILTLTTGRLPENWLWEIPKTAFTLWPILFFGTFMFTEPLTTPPTKKLRIWYGILVGILFGAPFSIGNFYLTSEMALVIGNIFSFAISTKKRLRFWLMEKIEIANSIFVFYFKSKKTLSFFPGQYLEFTLGHKKPDSRGNRRYFTIASSPTENNLLMATKIIDKSSSFKKALKNLEKDTSLVAGELAGEFILPSDPHEKMVWIAGGIGITPFRSMTKYLIDIKEKRDIVLFYNCANKEEFAFKNIFNEAVSIGLKTIYIISNPKKAPVDWHGKTGFINEEMLKKEVLFWKKRVYYLSGPEAMVNAYIKLLKKMGIRKKQIIKDYFPGY